MKKKQNIFPIIIIVLAGIVGGLGGLQFITNTSINSNTKFLKQSEAKTELVKNELESFYKENYQFTKLLASSIAYIDGNNERVNHLNDALNLSPNFSYFTILNAKGQFVTGNTVNRRGDSFIFGKEVKNNKLTDWIKDKNKTYTNDFNQGLVGVYFSEVMQNSFGETGQLLISPIYNQDNSLQNYLVTFLDLGEVLSYYKLKYSSDISALNLSFDANFEGFDSFALNEFETPFLAGSSLFIYASFQTFEYQITSIESILFGFSFFLMLIGGVFLFWGQNLHRVSEQEVTPLNKGEEESQILHLKDSGIKGEDYSVLEAKIELLEKRNRAFCQHKDDLTKAYSELRSIVSLIEDGHQEVSVYIENIQKDYPKIIDYSKSYFSFFNKVKVECTNLEMKSEREDFQFDSHLVIERLLGYVQGADECQRDFDLFIDNYKANSFKDEKIINQLGRHQKE
jgi:hypothetical protein